MSSYAAGGTQDAEEAADSALAPAADDGAAVTGTDAGPALRPGDVPAGTDASGAAPAASGELDRGNEPPHDHAAADASPGGDTAADGTRDEGDDGEGDGEDDGDRDEDEDDGYYYYDEDEDEDGYYYDDDEDGDGDGGGSERPKVSRLAVVALITGVLALVPVALVTGIAALIGIRRSGRRGHGMAVSALFFAAGWVALAGGLGAIAHFTTIFRRQVNIVYVYRQAPVFALKEGDCVSTAGGRQAAVVSCNSPHEAEVFATFTLPGRSWPGTATVRGDAASGCSARLASYLNPQLTISLTQTYIYPDRVDWTGGTRTVVCEVQAASGLLTQSVRAGS
jgi:hypothetical protein